MKGSGYILNRNGNTKQINEAKLKSWNKYCNIPSGTNPWHAVYKLVGGTTKKDFILTTLKKPTG